MKICYLADASSIHTYRWVTYFAKKGYKVSIISLKRPTFNYQGIDTFLIKKIKYSPNISSHLVNFLPVIFQISRARKHIQADVFHALGSTNGWLAALVGFSPLIFTIADPGIFSIPYQRKLSKIYKILNKYSMKKSNLLVCDGENTKEAMINLGAYPEKIKIVRFGVDIQKFKPQKMDDKFKESLFGGNFKIVISTKPLRLECDVETLVKAIPEALREIPEARFLIVGDGDQKKNLVNLAKSLKISEAVKFIGRVPSEKIPLYLNLADVFVCTSLVETGLASSTAEAMACGLPVVVSDSGDNRRWIKDKENGFIFPLKGFKTLVREIIYVLGNKSFKEKAGKINRRMIEGKNNYYKEMKKMEKIYQQVANEK